jgi:hypothetical protein
MSHRAMNWALERRDLKPAPWRVLVMLADRHNKDTLRVDPEQALLAHDCNMSRSTVNRHLQDLESAGLLVRVPRVNPKTKKQIPTFYILAPDFAQPPVIEFAVSDYETRIQDVQRWNIAGGRVPNSDTVAVSQKTPNPCPKNGDSRVSKSGTNLVREPLKEPCAPEVGPLTSEFIDGVFKRFAAVYPRSGNRGMAEEAMRTALESGADAESIIAGAKAYATDQKGNAKQYIAYPDNWLARSRWVEFAPTAYTRADPGIVYQRSADAIKACKPWVVTHTTAVRARELIALGFVTLAECKAAGVNL